MNSRCFLEPEKRRQEGFTLLEALLAMVVFSIGVLAVLSMLDKAVRENDMARGLTEQSAMAESLIERLMPLPYDHADLANGSHPAVSDGRYSISWAVGDDATIANTKTITATVTWTERGQLKTTNLMAIKTIY
jgi:type IV pilus assembly protein PilV